MSVNDFLLDFAIASLFIMIGQLIRAKVKVVQKFFVPASMIAGFIALALGSQGLNILPFSEAIGSYAGVLIIVIFAAVGINGFSFSKNDFRQRWTASAHISPTSAGSGNPVQSCSAVFNPCNI